ncbi:hypothetical protein I317_01553 [Kwoniella heveanensis CBS 569]|nr:hypothetical protein I317_01553 [Kwoniella heveanensis CBS 569]
MDEPSFSRIIIDREADWLRVKNNVSSSIMGIMEARLSTMPGGKDGDAAKAMRAELEKRLGKVQEKMFERSKYNLQVNGQNYESYVDATEAFDETLDRNIWALQTESVKWKTDMAEKRKQLPQSFFRVEEDLELRRADAEWFPDDPEDEKDKLKAADIPPPPRHEEVKKTLQTAVENITEVAKSVPVQLQRAQRAQTVREEISSLPP